MRGTLQRATVILALFFVSSAFGEVIFSRRVYKEHGASYQQIFLWNPADGVLKELTHSPRDHYHPTCDGRIVKFTSPSPDVTDDVKEPESGHGRGKGRRWRAGTARKTGFAVAELRTVCEGGRIRSLRQRGDFGGVAVGQADRPVPDPGQHLPDR